MKDLFLTPRGDLAIEDIYNSKQRLEINFITSNVNALRIINGDLAMEQAIKIRLLSSLGSISGNLDIGSQIEKVIHNLIDKDGTITGLKKYIKEAISDIISNPTIIIDKVNSKYADYSDTLRVTIIDNNNKYTVEI